MCIDKGLMLSRLRDLTFHLMTHTKLPPNDDSTFMSISTVGVSGQTARATDFPCLLWTNVRINPHKKE